MVQAAGIVPYRPDPLPQKSGSTFWRKDCVPTSAAECTCGATVGALRPTGTQIRMAAQVTEYRGLSYGEAVMGVVTWTSKQGRKVTPVARYGITRAQLKDYIDAGYRCVVSIACSVTVNTKRATNDYTGSHSVSDHDYRWVTAAAGCACERRGTTSAGNDHGEHLIEDPGTTTAGFLWWSSGLLYKAAEFRTGGHGINVVVFPDTESVTWKGVRRAEIRSKPSYQAGSRIAYSVIGQTYKGGRTETGGNWTRTDGTTANGWVHLMVGDKWGWVKANAVVQA